MLRKFFRKNTADIKDDGADMAVHAMYDDETKTLRDNLIAEKFAYARNGMSCRTQAFAVVENAEGIPDHQYYVASANAPLGKKWTIMRVTQGARTSVIDGVVPAHQFETMARDLTFFEAIEKMAFFEVMRLAHGSQPLDEAGLSDQYMNTPHFMPFAENEGILFTVNRMPEPSIDGRVVIPGFYDSSRLHVRGQEAQARRDLWVQSVLDITGQALNDSEPFEVILDIRNHAEGFRLVSGKMSECYKELSARLENLFVHKNKIEDQKLENAKAELDTLIDAHIPIAEWRRYLKQAGNAMLLTDALARHKEMNCGDVRKGAEEVARLAATLKFGKKDTEKLKLFLLTDRPVAIPNELKAAVSQMKNFVTSFESWKATIEFELMGDDYEIGRQRLQEYLESEAVRGMYGLSFVYRPDVRKWDLGQNDTKGAALPLRRM